LDLLIRKLVCDQQSVKMITPSEYLEHYPVHQVGTPCASSWGYKGYNEVWLNGKNDWAWRHLHHAAQRMAQLASNHPSAYGVEQRALNQALRELLLAQSSDWPFMMKTGQQAEYAVKRIKDHLLNFLRLADEIDSGRIDEPRLKNLEDRDNLFPFLDYRSFHP
jgi:1,4-alpha-glucan branching enzyme